MPRGLTRPLWQESFLPTGPNHMGRRCGGGAHRWVSLQCQFYKRRYRRTAFLSASAPTGVAAVLVTRSCRPAGLGSLVWPEHTVRPDLNTLPRYNKP